MADRILAELEHVAEEAAARKQELAVLPKPALLRKLRGQTSHSPFITSLSWNPVGARGGTISAAVGVVNPDPNTYPASQLFAHCFWGPGNIATDLDSFILSADPAFPRFAIGIQAPPKPSSEFRVDRHSFADRRSGRHVPDELAAAAAQSVWRRHVPGACGSVHDSELGSRRSRGITLGGPLSPEPGLPEMPNRLQASLADHYRIERELGSNG